MTRLLLCLALTACLQSHDPNTMAVGDRECVVCHQADYDGTSSAASAALKVPDHKALGFATTCVDCHVTQQNPLPWKLATNHPEKSFAVTGTSPHANIACTSCHNVNLTDPANPSTPVGSSLKGANTDCTSCHLNDAKQQSNHESTVAPITFPSTSRYAGQTYAYHTEDHRFCLDCHPNGLAGAHDETIFPSHHHNDGTCSNCHQPALGTNAHGDNAPCINSGCHGQILVDHGDGPPIGSDHGPWLCLQCHPHGQGGGNIILGP